MHMTEIDEILENNYIGRIACCKDDKPYLVPITYCYDKTDNSIIGYTGIGKKLHILRKNPKVCFEVDEISGLSTWKTVIASGDFIEMQGVDAKNTLHFFIMRIREISRNIASEHQLQFLKDMVHTDTHFPESVIYRINLTEKTGRYEN